MDTHEEESRASAAQDADATQFITLDSIQDDSPGPHHRRRLLLAVALGVLVALALLAAVAYTHLGHPAPART